MAGLTAGVYESVADIAEHWSLDQRFEPVMAQKDRKRKLAIWHKAARPVEALDRGGHGMRRNELLAQVRDTAEWDVIVIGGGASGLGAAVDASARGYRTLLLEQVDFAKATSSRSTKLVHGGVRYLQQGNISLVREALHERAACSTSMPRIW